MQCEVCGQQIFGAPARAIIEGAQMSVCSKCAKLGSGYWEPKPQPQSQPQLRTMPGVIPQPIQPFSKRKQSVTVPETFELVSDVGKQVRETRISLGLSHEDLGRKIREKVSVLRKIESGKMVPTLALAERLEHELRITIRVPVSEPEVQTGSKSKPVETTLGDLIKFKAKEAKK